MKAEKMLETIKKIRLSQLKRWLSIYQAFLVGFLVTILLTIIELFKNLIYKNEISQKDMLLFLLSSLFLVSLIIYFGVRFANTTLLVEFKEEGVHKWNRKKALKYIREEKEG